MKKTPPEPSRSRLKKGLVRFLPGKRTAQTLVEAANHVKDRYIPPLFLVEGDAISVFSTACSADPDNVYMTRTDVPVVNSTGVRVAGKVDELSAEILKTTRPSAIQFDGSKVFILREDGEVAEGVGGAGITTSDDPAALWNERVAPLEEVGHLPTPLLRGLIDMMQPFVGEDETRSQIGWAPVEVSPGLVQGVATNGHILVVRRLRSPLITATKVEKFGIPRKAMRALTRFQEPTTYLLKNPARDSMTWMARCGGQNVFMSHVDSFPPYDALLPSATGEYIGFDMSAPLLRSTVAEVVTQAAKTEKSSVVLDVNNGVLTINIGDTALRWTIPIEWTKGDLEPFHSVVGVRYLSQVVRSITENAVTTRIERASSSRSNDPELSPLYVRDVPFGDLFDQEDTDPNDAVTALMPMRA